MSDDTRQVRLTQMGEHRFKATNARGGVLPIGTGADPDFSPVELLLAAIAGCSALDVEFVTSRRAEPLSFAVVAAGEKIRDEQGNRLVDLRLRFEVTFAHDEAGDAARGVLPRAMTQSIDRICTVSRTVAVGTPVTATAT